MPVEVTFQPGQNAELWTRNFGGQTFSSNQTRGAGKDDCLLVERFGAISIALALVVDGDRLLLIPRRWKLLGIPMPQCFLPRGTTFETQDEGKFCFDVEISVPFIGLLVAYRGTLSPQRSL